MELSTAGELGRVDLGPIVALLPALRDEWAELTFSSDGSLINPLTGATSSSIALLDGRHRQAGARYRVTVTTPTFGLPESRRAEFGEDSRRLSRRNAEREAWDDHFARRRQALVQVGVEARHLAARLREDTARTLAFSLTDEDEHWTVEMTIVMEDGTLPCVLLSGRADLRALLRAEGTPGCFAGFLGGAATGTGTFDLAVLERGGRMIEVEGRARRVRGGARFDVRTSTTTWAVDGKGRLRARGLARPVMWFAGRHVRDRIEATLADLWAGSESRTTGVSSQMVRLHAALAEEGGPAPFVHRVLWDESFDPGLDVVRSDRRNP